MLLSSLFTRACEETLSALQVAVASVPTLKNFDVNAPENALVDKAFTTARSKIQGCFSHFEVGTLLSLMNCESHLTDSDLYLQLTSHWVHYEKIFQQAAEKDRTRTAQLGEVLTSVSRFLYLRFTWL